MSERSGNPVPPHNAGASPQPGAPARSSSADRDSRYGAYVPSHNLPKVDGPLLEGEPSGQSAERLSEEHHQPVVSPARLTPAGRPWTLRRTLQLGAGVSALLLGLASLGLPSPYLVESPGPIFDTTGEIEGEPVVSVSGMETDETDGELALTTVYVNGQPTSTVRVPDMLRGWASPQTDIAPHELVYPSGTTADDVMEMNTAAMTSSQDLAVAAALDQLDVAYSQELAVMDFTEEAREAGTAERLQAGDEVVAAGGQEITGIEGLRSVVNEAAGGPVELRLLRDGEEFDVEVPTYQEPDGEYFVGVMLQGEFDFPVEVEIRGLDNVGGPSAGLMFSLGIIDAMSEGSMTGGEHWAGSGTVDPDGTVGPIGGIAQKVAGARGEGAENFLVPRDNCPELEGRIPDGLNVYGVDDVAEAHQIVESVRDDDEDYVAGLDPCGQ